MLQQTQVERVLRMFPPFVKKFPDFRTLACADLADVYELWQGLGYNRRAKYLRDAARLIVDTHRGQLPDTVNALTELPGVGKNTAAAIIVYAYNIPVPYIETNIRTVYIHHFFGDRDKISDNDILTYVNATIDTESPRDWFWALMDYGTHLKKTQGNASRKSTAYRAQSTFAGSDRKLRGLILQTISEGKRVSTQTLRVRTENDPRTDDVARKLVKEGLIREDCGIYRIGE
jgi:A/G-specific adenine glycosylase